MSTDARLGDPRCYGTGKVSSPLLQLAETGLGPGELAAALRELAAAGRDSEIKDLLAAAPSQGAYARLWQGLCAAIEKPSRDEAVASRVFAIPWVIVTGAAAPATVTCVLPDIAGLARVLEEHGVFGASRNLGLSRIQRQYGRDIVVVGVMVNWEATSDRKFTDEQRDPKKLMERFDSMCRSFKFEHYLVPSLDSDPYKVINEDVQATPIPGLMILSSDTTCRWWQHEKARVNGFAALADILNVDPGVVARRKVEAEWLKARKGGK